VSSTKITSPDLLNELGAGVSRPCTLNPTEGIPTLMQTLTLDSGVYQLQVCPYFLYVSRLYIIMFGFPRKFSIRRQHDCSPMLGILRHANIEFNFSDWALPAQYKWTTALISKQFWNKVGSALAITLAQFFKFAPIDGFQLFDKVFLHEVS